MFCLLRDRAAPFHYSGLRCFSYHVDDLQLVQTTDHYFEPMFDLHSLSSDWQSRPKISNHRTALSLRQMLAQLFVDLLSYHQNLQCSELCRTSHHN